MVGLIPLFAVETLEPEMLERLPDFTERLKWLLNYRPDLAELVSRWEEPGRGERRLLSLLRGNRMKKLLRADARRNRVPLRLRRAGALAVPPRASLRLLARRRPAHAVDYEPAESDSGTVRRQLQLARADLVSGQLPDHRIAAEVSPLLRRRLQVECPTGLRQHAHDRRQVADELSRRLSRLFLRDADGRRPVFGDCATSCRTIRTSATTCCSTNTSTATTAAASVRRTKPAGPA